MFHLTFLSNFILEHLITFNTTKSSLSLHRYIKDTSTSEIIKHWLLQFEYIPCLWKCWVPSAPGLSSAGRGDDFVEVVVPLLCAWSCQRWERRRLCGAQQGTTSFMWLFPAADSNSNRITMAATHDWSILAWGGSWQLWVVVVLSAAPTNNGWQTATRKI